MAAITLVTAPTVEPLSTAEAKAHLRVTGADEDTLIDGLIKAAREQAEAITKRALITQTWDLKLDCLSSEIEIPKPRLQSVASVKYIDADGVEQTESASTYTVDTASEPGRVYLAYNQTWPTPRVIPHAVTIRFVAGYGNMGSDVPGSILAAMKLMIGHWFNNREEGSPVSIATIPMGANPLLGPYAVDRM